MEEKDRLGVTVVLEAGVAVASAAIGSPAMGLAAGLLPIADYYMSRAQGRLDQVNALVSETVEEVGATTEDFVGWMQEDGRHLALFHSAAEGAYETFDQEKIDALRRALVDGYRDEARIDLDTLVVKALRDFDSVHVVALDYYNGNRGDDVQTAAAMHRRLEPALGPILSTLERHGCIRVRPRAPASRDRGYRGTETTNDQWVLTEFGRQCLRYLRGEPEPPPVEATIW